MSASEGSPRPERPIRVLAADDHPVLLKVLTGLLESQPDLAVVGTARDGAEVLAAVERLAPDVVVMDLAMPVMDGIETARRLRKRRAGPRVVMLTARAEPEIHAEALRAGVSAVVLKEDAVERLPAAIRAAARGRSS
ncbi:MAG: response regulator transcription factor [Elusimicrobia bacterium]|nr:response regulator transcription factor [Elusimicrobiota bacterium]